MKYLEKFNLIRAHCKSLGRYNGEIHGMIEITSQNHGFAVDPDTLPSELTVNRINLNDQTVEGLNHRSKRIFSVQYHPEASPGPHDSEPLFAEFRRRTLQAA